MPSGDGGIWARTGFDLRQPWLDLAPDANGERHVRIAEMDRAEVWLGSGVEAAYLVANGTLRDLPVGAAMTGGHFTWVPGPGAIGPYQLAFLRRGERIDVHVTVAPATSAREGDSEVRMYLDSVRSAGCGVWRARRWMGA